MSLLWIPYLLDFAFEDTFDIAPKIFTNTPPCVFLCLPELWTPGGLFSRPPLLAWICPGICQRFKISWIKRKSHDLIFISQTPSSLQLVLVLICPGICWIKRKNRDIHFIHLSRTPLFPFNFFSHELCDLLSNHGGSPGFLKKWLQHIQLRSRECGPLSTLWDNQDKEGGQLVILKMNLSQGSFCAKGAFLGGG